MAAAAITQVVDSGGNLYSPKAGNQTRNTLKYRGSSS
jgi:hypothetical protein